MCISFLLSPQNKLKKIKEKYKDQDEEDRELMMQLLGVRTNKNDPQQTHSRYYVLYSDIAVTPSATFFVVTSTQVSTVVMCALLETDTINNSITTFLL